MATWRFGFVGAGLLILIGSPMHPGGTMEEMLADPRWLPGHLLVFAGFVSMTFGIVALRADAPVHLRSVLRLALFGTMLQAVEMFVHAMAYVDLGALREARSTPVLGTHLFMTPLFYPLFAATTIALIVRGAARRALGSWWIAPIGILGVAAHGLAGLLVGGFDVMWARPLFIGIAPTGLWLLLAGVWPRGIRKAMLDPATVA